MVTQALGQRCHRHRDKDDDADVKRQRDDPPADRSSEEDLECAALALPRHGRGREADGEYRIERDGDGVDEP